MLGNPNRFCMPGLCTHFRASMATVAGGVIETAVCGTVAPADRLTEDVAIVDCRRCATSAKYLEAYAIAVEEAAAA